VDKELSDTGQTKAVTCPHCADKRMHANGKLKGVQRCFCNGSAKIFSYTTGKFWYNIKKKDKVNCYLYCLLFGSGIRKSAKEAGVSKQAFSIGV
jgi:transposase-like protein